MAGEIVSSGAVGLTDEMITARENDDNVQPQSGGHLRPAMHLGDRLTVAYPGGPTDEELDAADAEMITGIKSQRPQSARITIGRTAVSREWA